MGGERRKADGQESVWGKGVVKLQSERVMYGLKDFMMG